MIEEKVLVQKFLNRKQRPKLRKPDWLKIKLGDPRNQNQVLELIDGLNLHTVCQEARCPNIFECWTDKTATFMLGGDTCTRHCGFCAVNKGKPMALDPMEPTHVAEAVKHLDLKHAVITSVNRDDLPDGGRASARRSGPDPRPNRRGESPETHAPVKNSRFRDRRSGSNIANGRSARARQGSPASRYRQVFQPLPRGRHRGEPRAGLRRLPQRPFGNRGSLP